MITHFPPSSDVKEEMFHFLFKNLALGPLQNTFSVLV